MSRVHKDRRLCEVLLNCYKCPIAFLVPLGLAGPPQGSEEGSQSSVKREIKLPRAANLPVSCWISFLELGADDFKMAFSCMGFASIPLYVTMKPRDFPALTPKAHFKGFSFIPYSRRMSKACWR